VLAAPTAPKTLHHQLSDDENKCRVGSEVEAVAASDKLANAKSKRRQKFEAPTLNKRRKR
jgi:hypothetical protein